MAAVSPRPGEREPMHRHHDARLVLFLDGAYTERSFDEATTCVRGDFLVRSALYGHGGVTSDAGARYVRLGLSPHAVREFQLRHGWCARVGRIALDRRALEELTRDPHGGDIVLARASVHSPAAAAPGSPLAAIALELAGESDTPLEDLAERNGVRPWTLSRAFKRAFGMTPSTFRAQARLQRALRRLAETSASHASIAVDSGFADQSHFNRALKHEIGLTPSAARRLLALA